MTDIAQVSGKLLKKDLKHLTGATRSGTVGPTTVYYAGVTAPIISAGVSVFIRNLLRNSDFISAYWLLFLSTLIAAFGGICWYLIFMRWSYRNSYGRGDEAVSDSVFKISETALILRRNHITTIIEWPAISEMQKRSKFITLIIEDGSAHIIPNHWFNGDKKARDNFHSLLKAHIES